MYVQTSLHQKLSMSKIPWEYSCFRQKNTLSDKNLTPSISGQLAISASYLPTRSMEHYFNTARCPFFGPQNG